MKEHYIIITGMNHYYAIEAVNSGKLCIVAGIAGVTPCACECSVDNGVVVVVGSGISWCAFAFRDKRSCCFRN